MRATRSLCPGTGYYTMSQEMCDNTFIKCEEDKGTMRGYLYQCPFGFTYWSISKRCERTSPILSCGNNFNYDTRWEIPMEMVS